MTTRYVVPTAHVLTYAVLACPFCGEQTTENPTMPWCSNRACLVEYRRARPDPETGSPRFAFDDRRKTARFALAKAVMAAGGVRVGAKQGG